MEGLDTNNRFSYIYACPKQGHGFVSSYIVVFSVFSNLRFIVHFFYISGIVDHHGLTIPFVIYSKNDAYKLFFMVTDNMAKSRKPTSQNHIKL